MSNKTSLTHSLKIKDYYPLSFIYTRCLKYIYIVNDFHAKLKASGEAELSMITTEAIFSVHSLLKGRLYYYKGRAGRQERR